MKNFICINILAGGKASRLEPLSSNFLPKQFLKFSSLKTSFFQQTLARSLKITDAKHQFIICNQEYEKLIKKQAHEISNDFQNFILEKTSNNTAQAILVSSMLIQKIHGNKLVLVLPSDHLIGNEFIESKDLLEMQELANENFILFGLDKKGFFPEFGYLEIEDLNSNKLKKFHEKPNLQIFNKIKNYLINSGIIFSSTKNIINSFKKHYPKLVEQIENIISLQDLNEDNAIKIDNSKIDFDHISIDKLIFENCNNLVVNKLDIEWQDVGSWEKIFEISENDFLKFELETLPKKNLDGEFSFKIEEDKLIVKKEIQD